MSTQKRNTLQRPNQEEDNKRMGWGGRLISAIMRRLVIYFPPRK
jgi:hypothetical protein